MKTLWQRAYEENKPVEEKRTGVQAKVVMIGKELCLDEGSDYVSPVTEFTEDDFWIVNE